MLHSGAIRTAHYHRPVPGLLRPAASVLAAAFLVLAAGGCGGTEAREQQPLRLLFVGNSLTAANDLPAAVAAIADEAGRRPLEVHMVAPGGVSLEEHWASTGARDLLAPGRWDAVVLQQGPSSLPESRAHLRAWAERWAREVRAHGARPALLMVWPEAARASAMPAVIDSYADAAAGSGAVLLPAGAAWRAAWRRDPELELYGDDDFHPSELGTRLTALVVYAGLTGASPAKLPIASVPEETARILRAATSEALAAARTRR